MAEAVAAAVAAHASQAKVEMDLQGKMNELDLWILFSLMRLPRRPIRSHSSASLNSLRVVASESGNERSPSVLPTWRKVIIFQQLMIGQRQQIQSQTLPANGNSSNNYVNNNYHSLSGGILSGRASSLTGKERTSLYLSLAFPSIIELARGTQFGRLRASNGLENV